MNFDVSHHNLLKPVEENTTSYKSTLSSSLFSEPSVEGCHILSLTNKAPKAAPSEVANLSSHSVPTKKEVLRSIPTTAERILDAPGLVDDYYLNLLDWSPSNILSVALGGTVYLWNATTSSIQELVSYADRTVTSVSWSPSSPQHIALGTSDHLIELWDAEKAEKVRTIAGHSGRVISLAWNKQLLSSGSFDTTIHNNDLRMTNPLLSTLSGHVGEVCGLKWSPDGAQLASGGNDNMLKIWQLDLTTPRFSLDHHKAAVKALAWCPFQASLLASGGGSADRTIKFWNTQTGSLLNSVDTESQVCAIQWSKTRKELVSSHGFSQNQLCVWKYPTMTKMAELTGHTQRVMHLALSPDGTTVCSGSADETLRFWRVFESTIGMPRDAKSGSGISKISCR
uniref:CDC20/Fizzy WD40 domain-containing protein n=1 Tax=Arcella intermedia TaxID=1963864 RepID=A0A6B2L5K7_9EUKA